MQDRLDGGLSILIRCPGSELPSNLAINKLTVDLYVTPRELVRNERVSGDAAVLVQAFCKDFALPHLERFVEQCKIESIRIPKPRSAFTLEHQFNHTNFIVVLAESVDINGPNHLPAFTSPLSSCIQCRASAKVKPEATDDVRHLSASAAVRESAALTPSAELQPPSTPSQTIRKRTLRQRRPADAFLYAEEDTAPIPLVIPDSSAPISPLISIGPNSNAVLDRFNLGDDILPRLYTLIGSACSSRWEAVLRSSPWNLTFEQVSNLSNALLADLRGTPGFSIALVFPFFPSVVH